MKTKNRVKNTEAQGSHSDASNSIESRENRGRPRWLPDEHLMTTETGDLVSARSVRRIHEESSSGADRVCKIHGQRWRHCGAVAYDEGTKSLQVHEVEPVDSSEFMAEDSAELP